MKSLRHNSLNSSPLPSSGDKATLKYKENVAVLFQKLNSLQQCSENKKSSTHSQLVSEFNQKESKLLDGNRNRADQLKSILKAISSIEKEMENQENEEEKMRRGVRTMIEAASRELTLSF